MPERLVSEGCFGGLSWASGFVGNDSRITHLAVGLGVKTIVVFGPTNPVIYKPISRDITVLVDDSDGFTKQSSIKLQKKILSILPAKRQPVS